MDSSFSLKESTGFEDESVLKGVSFWGQLRNPQDVQPIGWDRLVLVSLTLRRCLRKGFASQPRGSWRESPGQRSRSLALGSWSLLCGSAPGPAEMPSPVPTPEEGADCAGSLPPISLPSRMTPGSFTHFVVS